MDQETEKDDNNDVHEVLDRFELTDKILVLITTKGLNKILKKFKASKSESNILKAHRRTLKNRGYAAGCRIRKEEQNEKVRKEIADLRLKLIAQDKKSKELDIKTEDLAKQNDKLRDAIDQELDKINNLFKHHPELASTHENLEITWYL